MSASRSGLFFIVTFFIFNSVQSTEFVPCFMWSNKRTNERVPALNKISQDIFKEEIQQYLKDEPLIAIFAEQTLSPEDFAQHDESGVIFSNLAKLSKSTKVSYLPYVQNPIKALKHLDVTVTEVPLDKFGKSFEIPETDILIVNLNDVKDSENRVDMLKRHDAAIAKIFRDLARTHENVLAIYTAHHTSWVASEEVVRSRQARSLLQSDTADDNSNISTEPFVVQSFNNESGVYLYVREAALVVGKNVSNTSLTYTFTKVNSTNYTFTATGDTQTYRIELSMSFVNTSSYGYWSQDGAITLTLTNSSGQAKKLTVSSTAPIYAPNGFSFHCGDQTFSAESTKLILKDFQIQWFFTTPPGTTNKFDDAYDCVGFTTVPIWSGLFITTILLIIMSIGITMMMDIRTMDKFDDAKGKTITINAE